MGGASASIRSGDILAGGWRGKPRGAIRSSGYVIHTLEAALWCVDQASSFEEALILAVNLADDADTVGAVTGQLAGAVWGLSGIPDRWLAPLAWRTRLLDTAQALLVGGAARRGLPAFLRPNIGHSPEDAWIDKVLEGRWAAIPADLDYDESCELAHLLQG